MNQEVRVLRELDEITYGYLWNNLAEITEQEADWRPHPQANSVRWIVGHLCWFEEWAADAIDGTGRYLEDKGPVAYEEKPFQQLKGRFDAARQRYLERTADLGEEDLNRKISYFGQYDVTILSLLQTHVTHLAGHRYQVRYVRGCYSRAHRTDKSRFDPW